MMLVRLDDHIGLLARIYDSRAPGDYLQAFLVPLATETGVPSIDAKAGVQSAPSSS